MSRHDDNLADFMTELAVREANEASDDWRCPGCKRSWDDIPIGHWYSYSQGGSCDDTRTKEQP